MKEHKEHNKVREISGGGERVREGNQAYHRNKVPIYKYTSIINSLRY